MKYDFVGVTYSVWGVDGGRKFQPGFSLVQEAECSGHLFCRVSLD